MSNRRNLGPNLAAGCANVMRGFAMALACAGLAMIPACTHKPVVSQSRLASTGIDLQDGVAVLATTYRGPGTPDSADALAPLAPKEEKQDLERCLSRAILKNQPVTRILDSETFLERIAPGTSFPSSPRSADEVLGALADDEFIRRAREFNLRYIILLAEVASKGPKRSNFDTRVYFSIVGEEWDRTTDLEAEVLDVASGRRAGTVRASDTGVRGYVVPFILIIPLPPIVYGTRTRGSACAALGQALLAFLTDEEPGDPVQLGDAPPSTAGRASGFGGSEHEARSNDSNGGGPSDSPGAP